VSHFVSDPLGSVVMVRDNSGNTVYEAEYDPYGNVQSETGTNPSELGYVGTLGYVKDSAFSLYVRARYLLTNLGRWLTKDPLWPSEPGFVYANAKPTLRRDVTGLRPCSAIYQYNCSNVCRAHGYPGGACEETEVIILESSMIVHTCFCTPMDPIPVPLPGSLTGPFIANCRTYCSLMCKLCSFGLSLTCPPFISAIQWILDAISETQGSCEKGCDYLCASLVGWKPLPEQPCPPSDFDPNQGPGRIDPDRIILPKLGRVQRPLVA